MIHLWRKSNCIVNNIFIPKYYDPSIMADLEKLKSTHDLLYIGDLLGDNTIDIKTGNEIGKASYGTGDIPFIRTSDISNWELKSIPKQGVSKEIYYKYLSKQDIKPGDILLVKDGTYLIGTNCFITEYDKEILYQSHIYRIRILDNKKISPELLFLSLNSPLVQKQIRSKQFTADIIDTIGSRLLELILPIPKDRDKKKNLIRNAKEALGIRVKGKALIKNMPTLLEEVLQTNSTKSMDDFLKLSQDELLKFTKPYTITSEFGAFESFWLNSSKVNNSILLPKLYDPSIDRELNSLAKSCNLISMKVLKETGKIKYYTGDEIGKMAYGTGEIPFIRTSDFANWEIKHNPKQGISQEIYDKYKDKQDVQEHDLLLVRDGTYLVGSSCIITKEDEKSLFCGGLYKITINDNDLIDPFLFLGLINSFIVKRQIRTKQFTRDVIDTLGNRVDEIIIPIPRSKVVRKAISNRIKAVINGRIKSRLKIFDLACEITKK